MEPRHTDVRDFLVRCGLPTEEPPGLAGSGRRLLLHESDPARFAATFLYACANGHDLFLADPNWGTERTERAEARSNPHLIFESGTVRRLNPDNPSEEDPLAGIPGIRIMIPTGGTSGELKWAVHTWENLYEAAIAFCGHFGTDHVDSLCTLPLHHVSGLMQLIRSFVTLGRIQFSDTSSLNRTVQSIPNPSSTFLSLVPTQLTRLLDSRADLAALQRLRTTLLGGAPATEALLDRAREARLPLAPCYGSTETAAMICAMTPKTFREGHYGIGAPVPGAQLQIFRPKYATLIEEPGVIGDIVINAPWLFYGYYGEELHLDEMRHGWQSSDEGFLDEAGQLHIAGRVDRMINSGGEKIDPLEVEFILEATRQIREVHVFGKPDPEWGERAVAVLGVNNAQTDWRSLETQAREALASWQYPKEWIISLELPRTKAGKLDRERLSQLRGYPTLLEAAERWMRLGSSSTLLH